MKVEVLYKSHRYEEFDSSTQTCPEPYRGKGTNILTDWNLYLGSLEENGIVLVQHWYDGSPSNSQGSVTFEGVSVPAAARKVKNWTEADRIRALLQEAGIVLEDTPKGSLWRRE